MLFIEHYGYFLLCTTTIVVACLVIVAGIISLSSKNKSKTSGELTLSNLSDELHQQEFDLQKELVNKKQLKQLKQKNKADSKAKEKKAKLFVIDFVGDINASNSGALTHCVNAILLAAQPGDRVLACIESPGGAVHSYGLCAAQLQRLTAAQLHLTVAIDKVAASGGYMMACVADHIIAAPFAMIGSIGVIAQLPNFNKFLKKRDIDFEQLTAGDYKRTLTIFGENTDADRQKMQSDIDNIHELFKSHVKDHRQSLDISAVATGEYWYGLQALSLGLVDTLQTRDQYLLDNRHAFTIIKLEYKTKPKLAKRLGLGIETLIKHFNYQT